MGKISSSPKDSVVLLDHVFVFGLEDPEVVSEGGGVLNPVWVNLNSENVWLSWLLCIYSYFPYSIFHHFSFDNSIAQGRHDFLRGAFALLPCGTFSK